MHVTRSTLAPFGSAFSLLKSSDGYCGRLTRLDYSERNEPGSHCDSGSYRFRDSGQLNWRTGDLTNTDQTSTMLRLDNLSFSFLYFVNLRTVYDIIMAG